MKFISLALLFFFLSTLCYSIADTDTAHYCTPEERGPHPCPLYYMDMCAWYYQQYCTGVTIGGTCAENAGNSCFACSDSKVEKVTMGKCPE